MAKSKNKINQKSQNILKTKPSIFFVLLLYFFNILAHRVWFDPFAVVSNSEWFYFSQETLKSLHMNSWMGIQMYGEYNFLPIRTLISILGQVIQNEQIVNMIVFFLPIALITPVAIYLLVFRFTKAPFASFIGSLFYLFNGYYLVWSMTGYTLAFVYSVAPLLFLLFASILNKFDLKKCIAFIFLASLINFYELRLGLLLYFVLFCYFLFSHYIERRRIDVKTILRRKKEFFILIFLGIGMNFYLLLFSFSDGIKSAVQVGITSRELIKPGFLFLSNSFTTFYPFWTPTQPTLFFSQPTPWYFWFVPLYIFSSILFIKKDKYIIFFMIFALIFVYLGKGPTPPLGIIYEWSYENLPIFNFFIEGSKFWQILHLMYAILIAFSLKHIYQFITIHLKKKTITKTLFFIFLLPLFYIMYIIIHPAVTQELGPGYKSYPYPKEYQAVKNYFYEDKSFYRLLQVPTISRYMFFSEIHPRALFIFLPEYHRSLSPELLRLLGIRYVVVPSDPYYEVYPGNGPQELFKEKVEGIEGLEKVDILSSNDLLIYKNTLGSVPHIYTIDDLNSIKGDVKDFSHAQSLFENKERDIYWEQSTLKADQTLNPSHENIVESVQTLKCSVCPPNDKNVSGKYENLILDEDTQKDIYIRRDNIENVTLTIDDSIIYLNNDENWFYAEDIQLTKGRHSVKLIFEKENLALQNDQDINFVSNKELNFTINDLTDYTPYYLSFDYKMTPDTKVYFQINQNTDYYYQYQQNKPGGKAWNAFSGDMATYEEWNTAGFNFPTTFNAKQSILNFKLSSTSNKEENFLIRNISFVTNNNPEIYFYEMKEQINNPLPQTIFEEVNPAKYRIQITNAEQPFYLVFSESYNRFWKLSLSPENNMDTTKLLDTEYEHVKESPYRNDSDIQSLYFQKSSEKFENHFMINGFANAWYIDRPGTYNLSLEFTPQKEYMLGFIISLLSFIATACFFLIVAVKNLK